MIAVDDKAGRPSPTEIAQGWQRTTITAVEPLPRGLAAVADALTGTHVNGGARVAQFRIEADPALAWILSGNWLREEDFFARFFAHPGVLAALPEAADARPEIGEFEQAHGFTAFGQLAGAISDGGAYQRFEGGDKEALLLARDFARDAFELQISRTFAWVNWKPWSPWFYDVAWDASFFWLDWPRCLATILLITDTD